MRGISCYTCFLLLIFCVNEGTANPPHIVFILADDFGWNDVSFHGSPQIPTPNLDTLAYSGLILHNYYVTPLCTPSRSALMTGKHPIHTGMQHDVIYAGSRYGLPLTETILPEHLTNLGYENHIVGKWHLGSFKKTYTPLQRGFKSHYGYWMGHQDYFDHTHNAGDVWGYDMRRNYSVDWSAFGKYTTRVIAEEAAKVIEDHSSPTKSLFLYVPHLAVHSANPHSPLQAPPETVALFSHITDKSRRQYAAMVHELDQSVGRIVLALKKKHMLENCIIVFSTDNGGPAAGFNQNAASNWPLKGVKNTPWEGGVRGASFVWSPLLPQSRRGQVVKNLMDIADWLPTLFEAAGGNTMALGSLDGVSHWKTLMYDAPSLRTQTVHNIDDGEGYAALRKDNWKLVKGTTYHGQWDNWYGPSGRLNETASNDVRHPSLDDEVHEKKMEESVAGRCLQAVGMKLPRSWRRIRKSVEVDCGRRQRFAATPCRPLDEPCLFDVASDPCELDNVAAREPTVVRRMLALLNWYNATALPPLNTPFDPMANPKYWNYTIVNWADYL